MLNKLFRYSWRLTIFILGLLCAWILIFKFYPFVDSRLPAFIVVLLTYIILVYLLIPGLIRIFRIFEKPNHIPLYAVSTDGWPSDPVNIAIIVKNREQLISSMKRAGWYQADPPTIKNGLRAIRSMVLNSAYPTAPFSPLYLFGRTFDLGFQKPTNPKSSPRSRHHVRFWKLQTDEANPKSWPHFWFWHDKLNHLLGIDKEIWIGASILDTNILGIRWRSGSLTHQISPDVDAERDLIITDLKKSGLIQSTRVIAAGEPLSFRGQTIRRGKRLICDGTLTVVSLRNKKPIS